MEKSLKNTLRGENKNPSEILEQKHPIYKAIKKIGQGSFGKAYLVES